MTGPDTPLHSPTATPNPATPTQPCARAASPNPSGRKRQ